MNSMADHPSVKRFYEQKAGQAEPPRASVVDAAWLRQICLDAGADDVGFVERDRREVADQDADIRAFYPATTSLISFVVRMNRDNVRTPARSIANLEFHRSTDEGQRHCAANCRRA